MTGLDVSVDSDLDGTGTYFGLGVDYPINERMTVGLEVNQHQFDDFGGGIELEPLTVGLNLAYRF